nr:hypothetical protein GCM10010200_075810 [Actinomadura rugatobispora]
MAVLGRVPLRDVEAYLSNGGWEEAERIGGSTLWALTHAGEDREVVVPGDETARDYVLRMVNLLQVLSETEDRPRPQILRDLTTVSVDRHYVRTHPGTPPGTISVADGLQTVDGIRELLIVGAYAVVADPVLVLPRRKPHRVEEFPKRARLGPSSEGSYVLSVEVPLDEDDGLFAVDQPFGRRAMLRLYDAVRAAHSAAGEALDRSELSPFTERVGEGISANLCRALSRFGGAEQDHPFELRFSWALSLPTGVRTPPIRFDEAQVSVLAQAEEDLDDGRMRDERVEVTGKIWRTERDRPTEPGWVVIKGVAATRDKRMRRLIWVRLHPDLFNLALRAAEYGATVRAAGVLARSRKRTELRSLTSFTIEDG